MDPTTYLTLGLSTIGPTLSELFVYSRRANYHALVLNLSK